MKRVSAPRRRNEPSECHTLHILFDYLWQTYLEPVLSNNKEGAHAFALAQHRIIEIIRHRPKGIACAISLLNTSVMQSYAGKEAFKTGLKEFEARIAEAFKTEVKIEQAMKKRADVRPINMPVSRNGELPERPALQFLFDDLWRLFLQPAIAENPDAGYTIALMHRRIGETIERGPKGIVCAISLLTKNIKQAFKYTKAHKEHKVSFNVYVRYLDGNKTPENELGII